MKPTTSLLPLLVLACGLSVSAQVQQQQTTTTTTTSTTTASSSNASSNTSTNKSNATSTAITATSTPVEMARAAYAALGGDKFRNLKSLVLIGTADLFSPNSTQALPAKFAIVSAAGDRYRMEIQSPAFSFQQIHDGQRSYTSLRTFDLPSPGKFGFPLLTKFEQSGYTVTALPDKKKLRAFRITDSEGNATDFYIDPQTARIVSYESSYNGMRFGVENKQYKEFEGVLVPMSFVQKFDTQQGSFFAEFKVKDVKLNQTLADDMFVIPTP